MPTICVSALSGRRLYGYDIIKRLRGVDGLMIGEGTVYPILSRFHREGLVTTTLEESSEGPARKYYELTARGRQELVRMLTYWTYVRNGIDATKERVLSGSRSMSAFTDERTAISSGSLRRESKDVAAPLNGVSPMVLPAYFVRAGLGSKVSR